MGHRNGKRRRRAGRFWDFVDNWIVLISFYCGVLYAVVVLVACIALNW